MKKVVVPLIDGCEEIEATCLIDTLRRAGWEVTVAGFKAGPVEASRGLHLVSDALWRDVVFDTIHLIAVPGGARGTENLRKRAEVLEVLRHLAERGGWVAAICAGPLVLQDAGLLSERTVTCHPAVKNELRGARWIDQKVVADGKVVTSQGPGTALDFALGLIELLEGEELADRIAGEMVYHRTRPYVVAAQKQ